MIRTNERAMNIADALRVAIQHQTNSTGRTALRYDRLDNLLYADSSDLFHFPSVIDTNLLAMVQHSKLQSSCQTARYPQTPCHIRSLPMVHRSLPLFTETYDYRQPSEPSYPKSIVPASCLVEPIYNNWIINNTRQKARAWSAVYWIAVARSAHVVQTFVPLVCPLMSILALFAGSQWFSISGYKQIYNYE